MNNLTHNPDVEKYYDKPVITKKKIEKLPKVETDHMKAHHQLSIKLNEIIDFLNEDSQL